MAETTNKLYLSPNYNRTFSEEFRKQKVRDLEKGIITKKQLCELYSISRTTVYKWIYLYSKVEKGIKTVVQMESEEQRTKLVLQRNAELERIIGQKQIQIDYLEQVLKIAGEELGYDIKKKYGPAS